MTPEDMFNEPRIVATAAPWTPKCISCIGDYHVQMSDYEGGILRDNAPTPKPTVEQVNDAITLAPQWVPAPGGQGMGIAVVPTCQDHLQINKKSIKQRASESGLVLPD